MNGLEDKTIEEELKETTTLLECRICQDQEPEEDLIIPCKCSGSLKYIHRKCLLNWVNYKSKVGDKSQYLHCTICGERYKVKWTRPNIFDYIIFKAHQFSLDYTIRTFGKVMDHLLFHICEHFLICWIVKILALYFGVVALLFVGRLELWLVSSETTWEQFKSSLEGTMDNLLLILLAMAMHSSLIFIIILLGRVIISKNRGARASVIKRNWAEVRTVVAITFFGLAAICLPGYKARFLLYLFLDIPFNRFEVNFGTGRNFSGHFISGLVVLLIEASLVKSINSIVSDFTKFREARAKRVLYD